MKQLSSTFIGALAICLAATAGGSLGCSSDDSKGSGGASGAGGTSSGGCNNLPISFNPMYSAYDGKHKFQIPAIANGPSAAAVHWSAEPDGMVVLDQQPDLLMITTQKAGTVTIKATTDDGQCGTSLLTITDATSGDLWDTGDKRYNNGNALAELTIPSGGRPTIPDGGGGNLLEQAGKPAACTNCHGDTANSQIFKTISHTPQQTGGLSDQQLIEAFTQGKLPSDAYYADEIIAQPVWSFFHRWTVAENERLGVVIYLRSLTPKEQGGKFDFAGITRRRDGGSFFPPLPPSTNDAGGGG